MPVDDGPLGQDEAGYRLLFDRNPWPMWVYDSETLRFLAVNQAATADYGYSEDEFLQMGLADIRPAEDRAALQAHLARPLPQREAGRPWRHRRRNGVLIDVEIASAPITFAGRPARLVMAKDITQQLRAEAALRDSEHRLRRIVETATEGIWTIDTQAVTTFVNPKMAQMLGWQVDEMLGRPLADFMDAQAWAIAQQNLQRRSRGLAEQHDFRFRRRDGSDLWLSLATNPVLDDAGRYAGALAMATDITLRRRDQAREASRQQVLTLIAGGAPLARVLDEIVRGIEATQPGMLCSVLLLDRASGRLTSGAAPSLPDFFNAAVDGLAIGPLMGSCGTAAYTGQRVIVSDIQHDPHWAAYTEIAARAGLAACWSEPIRSHAGAVLGTFGVYHRQVHAPTEDELAAVTEVAQMAAIAIERKLTDEALRESQKMESLGTLAGGIAHDFNNILGAILGNVALARHDLGTAGAVAPRLEQIQQSALRARHLVQQILAFSRRQPRQALRQPLGPLVEETLALLRATLPANVRLQTRLAAEVPEVEVDATQIQQVLMNLGTNAWHAMTGAGGEIELGLDAVTLDAAEAQHLVGLAPGRCAHLWVRDSGTGMDAATRARIFEPFFTTKPVGAGTGLGLAVVHGIVSEHHGAITVDSAPGRGATFHLYFPAAQGAAPAPSAPAAAPVPPPLAAPAGAPAQHILCVDDDAVMLLTDEGLLTRQGYRVTAVASGCEAVDAVREAPGRFDLVVSDFNMPGSSGLDVAREIAAIRPDLPVVICSGYIDADLRARAAQAGVRALVHKENIADDLAEVIRRVLGGGTAD